MINHSFKQNKASCKYCPRCGKKSVNRDKRMCMECKGRLLWSSDEYLITEYINEKWGFFVWYKSIFSNDYAWYDKSYFIEY